ncbi:MAG: Lrp/AsnC family transcriptional regulator [Saccharopolyspora sp.]|uniref:Lrp/AsnC family transcriptional regulator n=1 Tax=Saccharopolyspora sp. TaxID=33915 RepID=UPI0025D9A653|nr:Lrp/AsnC family transcriptional regulator [Saccharopolyspora sp.]MBQ6642746.1 Lrp/AsnC family transcriptional regulator [Saccharopolyspora sp.]
MHPLLDEQDLSLLHALQIAPRVSWADAARVLGSTATTLAARWERLRSSGTAWVTAHAGGKLSTVTLAFVELDVAPQRRSEVIGALCRDPRAATIDETASGRDLIITVLTPDHDSLTRFALDELPRIPGVQRVDTHLATKVHAEGSRWRLDALDPAQRSELQAAAPRTDGFTSLPEHYWPLVEALIHDGRRSAADIARVLDRNPATVRRQVGRLLASEQLSFRCDVAQVRSQWPMSCIFLAELPAAELDRTVRSLRTLAELRLCVSTVGKANLLFQLWARSPADLRRLELLLAEKLPRLSINERVLVLRVAKRMGWLLDESGRCTGEVVVPSVTPRWLPG